VNLWANQLMFSSVEIAKVILSLDLPPSKLDIGMNYEFWKKI
jgi:hypothetical protein